MAAQVITVTSGSPTPAPIVLSQAISTAHISGDFGNNGAVAIEASDDGVAPYAVIGGSADIGNIGQAPVVIGLVIPAGWRVRARAARTVNSVRIAVE